MALTLPPRRKAAPPPPGATPREPPPRIPFGVHPVIDLVLLMNMVTDTQRQLAEGFIKLRRGFLICTGLMLLATAINVLAVTLPRLIAP